MTKYDLLDVLGTLDEKYLQEAEQRAKQLDDFDEEDYKMNTIEMTSNDKQRKFPVYFGATIAAGLALVVGATFFFANHSGNGLTVPAASSPENSAAMTEVTAATAVAATSEESNVDVTTGSIAEAVTSTTTVLIENSMPDPTTTPAQTQDPSLITTGPESNNNTLKENMFGGINPVYVLQSKDGMLMFSDKSNVYLPEYGLQYAISDLDQQVKVTGTKMKDAKALGLNNGAQFFSDGQSLYAFDNFMANRMIYRLYPDGTAWMDVDNVPFENAENIMVNEMHPINNGWLFIFQDCMYLDGRLNHSAYIYSDKTWTQIPVSSDSYDQYGFGSWQIQDGKLTVCRPTTEGQAPHFDFITYDLNAEDPTAPVKQIVDVDTHYVQCEGGGSGYGAFCGAVNDEWCIDQTGTIYVKSMEAGDEVDVIYNLYRLDTQSASNGKLTGTAVKLRDHIGNYLCAAGGYIYTNNEKLNADGSLSTEFVRYNTAYTAFSDPEVLLKNAQVLHAAAIDDGTVLFLSLSTSWENGHDSYVVYRIASEELLLNGENSGDAAEQNYLTYFTGNDWDGSNDFSPVPERARK